MKTLHSAHSFQQGKIVAFSWTVEETLAVETVEDVMKYSQTQGNSIKMIGAVVFPRAEVATVLSLSLGQEWSSLVERLAFLAFFAWNVAPHWAPLGSYHEYRDRASMSWSY